MTRLILGLLIFLGVHSVRIVAEPWRTQTRERLGVSTWRAVYGLLSLLGLWLIIWGFGLARQTPVQLWAPPVGMRHASAVLMALAFVLLAAAYVPGNQIKAKLGHPMVAAVKTWALAHVLANGNLHHLVLFGSFLIWSALSFRAARQRDRAQGTPQTPVRRGATLIAVVLGLSLWLAFTLWLHGLLIGVRPMG
jgi:uncharacterized membrane protein